MKRKLNLVLTVVVVLAGLLGYSQNCYAMSVEELRQIVTESKSHIKQVRIKCREEVKNNRDMAVPDLVKESLGTGVIEKINLINNHQDRKIEYLIDRDRKIMKSISHDLRDIPNLLKKHGLPEKEIRNVTKTSEILVNDHLSLQYRSKETFADNTSQLHLNRPENEGRLRDEMLYSGLLDKSILTKEYSPVLSEKDDMLTINITTGQMKQYTGVIKCDPSLGYRIREMKWYLGGRVIQEVLLDDYKMVDGLPYPFSSIARGYSEKGNILEETKRKIESVDFDKKFKMNDFKLDVTAGTLVIDYVLSGRSYRTQEDSLLGIEDLLSAETDLLVDIELRKMEEAASHDERIVILPNVHVAFKAGNPFVFDLETGALVRDIHFKNFGLRQSYLDLTKLGKGDLAWDGSRIVLLRDASYIKGSQSQKDLMKQTKGKWVSYCEFPEDAKLPYEIMIKIKEGYNFMVMVREIRPDGLEVTIRKVLKHQ